MIQCEIYANLCRCAPSAGGANALVPPECILGGRASLKIKQPERGMNDVKLKVRRKNDVTGHDERVFRAVVNDDVDALALLLPKLNIDQKGALDQYESVRAGPRQWRIGYRSPLAEASRNGSLAAVHALLAQDPAPNLEMAEDENGFSVLELAAVGGHRDVVRALLDRGARIDGRAHGDPETDLFELVVLRRDGPMLLLLLSELEHRDPGTADGDLAQAGSLRDEEEEEDWTQFLPPDMADEADAAGGPEVRESAYVDKLKGSATRACVRTNWMDGLRLLLQFGADRRRRLALQTGTISSPPVATLLAANSAI